MCFIFNLLTQQDILACVIYITVSQKILSFSTVALNEKPLGSPRRELLFQGRCAQGEHWGGQLWVLGRKNFVVQYAYIDTVETKASITKEKVIRSWRLF